jgi:prolyl 4-hydroxylase
MEVTPEWTEWIIHNLSRGVSADRLIEDMAKNHIDPVLAKASVARHQNPLAQNEEFRPSAGWLSRQDAHEFEGHTVRVSMRFTAPRITVLQDVLDVSECGQLMQLAAPRLVRSTIVDPASGAALPIEARSSAGMYFARGANPLVTRIERRLAAMTGMPVEHGEGLQVLRYGPGAEYRPHFDYFDPTDSGSDSHLARGGQRISTTILYLNDVTAGGATTFPAIGLSVSARRGCGVHFTYCDAEGRLDRNTLHGGAPVRSGEKWIATHWVRQGPYR